MQKYYYSEKTKQKMRSKFGSHDNSPAVIKRGRYVLCLSGSFLSGKGWEI